MLAADLERESDEAERRAGMTGARRQVIAPPLAPHLPNAGTRRVLLSMTTAAVVLAGLSYLSGAPLFISAAILCVGFAAFALSLSASREARRVASLVDEQAADRAQIETLADRMWEMQESEERFRGLIDALGDIVVHRDREGRIVYANRVLAELIGCEPRDLSGRTLSEFGIEIGVMPDAAFSADECLSSTDVAIKTNGETRWFSWIELSVRDKGGGGVSHRAIARDITARKRAERASTAARERAEFANRAKSRFLATVSHEIRTPMNGIMGMAKLLADTSLSPEQRTYVGAISTSASALLALIEDLLDFSKIEAGRLDLEPQPVALRELVDNVAELLASRAFAKKIGLGCFCAPDVPARITADPGRLRQVLLNLIGNAVKFTDSGGVLVSVTMAAGSRVPAVRIAVADTGPGLAKSDMKRIFQEFEQADSTSTRAHGGAGLGLAISRRIVEAMQGSIGVASELGAGSEFHIEIPIGRDAVPAEAPPGVLKGLCVVLLSTNAAETEAIARTIRAHGGDVLRAASAEESESLVLSRPQGCDAVLIDAALDASDGRLLKKLRHAIPTPFQAVTLIGPSERGQLAEYRANGYANFLARPVRGETLLRVLASGHAAELAAGGPQPETAPSGLAGRRDGLSVLIAEDNEINAMLARAALTKAGHLVQVVGNGRAAVEAVTQAAGQRFDVVLMDLHMPVMDGLDAIALIRKDEEEKGLVPLPIMVLSADSQEGTRHSVLAHGATGFVGKPIDPKALVEAVAEQAVA